MYWLLCTLFPIPGMSSQWLEVGEEVRNPSLVYDTTGGDVEQGVGKANREKNTYVTETPDSGSDKEGLPGRAV